MPLRYARKLTGILRQVRCRSGRRHRHHPSEGSQSWRAATVQSSGAPLTFCCPGPTASQAAVATASDGTSSVKRGEPLRSEITKRVSTQPPYDVHRPRPSDFPSASRPQVRPSWRGAERSSRCHTWRALDHSRRVRAGGASRLIARCATLDKHFHRRWVARGDCAVERRATYVLLSRADSLAGRRSDRD